MRAVELAKVAASAEKLRLQRVALRNAWHIAFYAVAGVFAVAAFVVLHVVAYNLLVPSLTPFQASLVLLAADSVLAGVFFLLARRDRPDALEREAKLIRQQALAEMKSALTITAVAGSAVAMVLGRGRRVDRGVPVGRRGKVMLFGDLAYRLLARR